MKPIRYAVLATVMGAMFSFGQAAFAQSADSGVAGVAATAPAAQQNTGKTRAEVRAELVQAEQQGLVPISKNDYPPTPQTIARNRAEYQAAHMDDHVSTVSN